MAALRSLTIDERDEFQRELDASLAARARYRHNHQRIRKSGGDRSWRRKLVYQIRVLDRCIARFRRELETPTLDELIDDVKAAL